MLVQLNIKIVRLLKIQFTFQIYLNVIPEKAIFKNSIPINKIPKNSILNNKN